MPTPTYNNITHHQAQTNAHLMIARAKAGMFKPNTYITTTSFVPHKPSTIKSAISLSTWFQAMQDE